jgi:EAL domain-containing protein (putative c-di-GMP-specific phosphodiesterase class I)
MARALGLTVVMEGVETEEQLSFLRAAGCHQVQGYLLARPTTADEASTHFCQKTQFDLQSKQLT